MTSPVIFGCRGPVLGEDERRFFGDSQPVGFILFSRNINTPDQVARLVESLREAVGRPDTMILIDQEGGRVQRLAPPVWPQRPPMRRFGELAEGDPETARECARLNAVLIATDLVNLGIDVNCAPVLDLLFPDGHPVIGDRAFSSAATVVAALGRAVCEGLLAGGVLPVVKHLPGHGRATSDSHVATPHVYASRDDLGQSDWVPFAALRDAPAGMTAHVVYSSVDGNRPASISPRVIGDVIRREIGFDGLLISDDVGMAALFGAPAHRVRQVLDAGCDIALHCDGHLDSMVQIAEACPDFSPDSLQRLERARAQRLTATGDIDSAEIQYRVDEILSRDV